MVKNKRGKEVRMKIRKATIKDIQRIAELGIEYGKYEHSLDSSVKIDTLNEEKRMTLKFFKDKEIEWFVLEDDSKVVGFVSLSVERRAKVKRAVFHTIFVEKEYRGKGEGTRLLKHALDYLKKKGCVSIRSFAYPKNKKAAEYYKKLGFDVSLGYYLSKGL